jgi:hypothetical protein
MALALITFLYFFSWRPLFGESPPHEKFNSFLERCETLSEKLYSIGGLYGMMKQVKRVMPKSLLAYAKILIGFW